MGSGFDHGAATALRNLTVPAALQEASCRRQRRSRTLGCRSSLSDELSRLLPPARLGPSASRQRRVLELSAFSHQKTLF